MNDNLKKERYYFLYVFLIVELSIFVKVLPLIAFTKLW